MAAPDIVTAGPPLAGDGTAWVTTVLRPARRLDRLTARALRPALLALTVLPGLVVVDLTAATPVSAEGWRVLSSASSALDAVGGGLLVVGVDADDVPDGAASITVLPRPVPRVRAVG
jgi:hypothetical protein